MGWLWPCPQILRQDWKGFPRANPLAYWASSSVKNEKSFITLTPGQSRLTWHSGSNHAARGKKGEDIFVASFTWKDVLLDEVKMREINIM